MVDIVKYKQIVEKYRKPLVIYCIRKFGVNTSFIEETVNDVFCVLYEKWDTFDTDGDMNALLYEIARRCVKRNYADYRKYYSHKESLEKDIENGEHAVWYDEYFSGDDDVEENIQKIKSALPENYRIIFEYRFIEKKTINEISEILKIPYSSLRYHLMKIEQMVRKEIKKIFY